MVQRSLAEESRTQGTVGIGSGSLSGSTAPRSATWRRGPCRPATPCAPAASVPLAASVGMCRVRRLRCPKRRLSEFRQTKRHKGSIRPRSPRFRMPGQRQQLDSRKLPARARVEVQGWPPSSADVRMSRTSRVDWTARPRAHTRNANASAPAPRQNPSTLPRMRARRSVASRRAKASGSSSRSTDFRRAVTRGR